MQHGCKENYTKKNFMAPIYGWGSIISMLQPLQGDSLFFPTSPQEVLVLIRSTSDG